MNYTFVFFGSDEFSIIVLQELISAGYAPTLCVTQPDKPKGRKLVLTPTPVKEFCTQHNLPCITPSTLETDLFNQHSFDFFVVASYGKIIPQKILDIPKNGSLNVHPSLLPLYRGASPIETTILEDTKHTGVTIMLMDAQMDHGPIITQVPYTVTTWPTHKKELHDTLAKIGGQALAQTIEPFLQKEIIPTPQDHTQATFTRMIQKNDGQFSIEDTSYQTYLKYLAYTPWPGVFFFIKKQDKETRIKVESAHYDDAHGCIIDTVIPEGKKSMSWESFRNGYLS